jgi:hypothetical protein
LEGRPRDCRRRGFSAAPPLQIFTAHAQEMNPPFIGDTYFTVQASPVRAVLMYSSRSLTLSTDGIGQAPTFRSRAEGQPRTAKEGHSGAVVRLWPASINSRNQADFNPNRCTSPWPCPANGICLHGLIYQPFGS